MPSSSTARRGRRSAAPELAPLHIERRFTTAGEDPFETVEWTRRDSRITNPDGSVVFELTDVEVPANWDQGALDIVASKYFRKTGVPQLDPATGQPLLDADGNPVLGPERSVRQVAHRLANAWRLWGERGGYFATEADAQAFYDEVVYTILHQMAAPNSPQWFNTGLFEAYGIVAEPEGNWYVDPATGEARESEHRYERSAANACFILAPEDELVGDDSIMRHVENEARLFKSGSGSGANYSKIREAGAPLSAGGTSSGLMSFLKVMDRAAGAIKSGGTTRRAARMVIVDADHPDIEEFIWCKAREEDKVAALVAAGYSSDWQGEAYETVAFQNANHSVRLPAGFMDSVAADEEWSLLSRVDGSVVRTVRARDLWRQIAEAAWKSADPGVQFDDILNGWNTVADTERVRGSNPCFTADTLVHTTKGLVTFGELLERSANGEEFRVYTHDATAGEGGAEIVATTPEAFMVTGYNPVVRLEFDNGMTVRCTPNHRFWTEGRGWVRADELNADDDVRVADAAHLAVDADWEIPVSADPSVYRNKGDHDLPLELPGEWSEDLGHYLGWLVGDGSVNGTAVISIYGSAEDRDEILPQHLPLVTKMNGGREPKLAEQPNGTVQLRITRRPFRAWLEALGMAKVTGHNKRVPWTVLQAPSEVQAAFLAGLFDADGSVVDADGRRWIQLGSTSWDLLVDVQRMLSTFGITSKIWKGVLKDDITFTYTSVEGEERSYARRHACHSLRISGESMVAYARHIGFRLSRKQDRLAAILAKEQYRSRNTTRMTGRFDDGVELTFNLTEPRNHSYMVNGLVVSNCSEFTHVDHTACNLASLNLGAFYDTTTQTFDVDAYVHTCRLWTVILEITVAMSHYPTRRVAEKSFEHRPLGLGVANLGAVLMRAGLPYDSDAGRAAMGAFTGLMHHVAYATSAELAAAVGPCIAFEPNRNSAMRVLRNHRRAAYGTLAARHHLGGYEDLPVEPVGVDHLALAHTPFGSLSEPLREWADRAVEEAEVKGLRNMQVTVAAPTGCLTGDSLVTSSLGEVRLQHIGDRFGAEWQDLDGVEVQTDEGPRAATKFYVNGLAEVVEVRTKRGHRLSGTPQHRVRVLNGSGEWVWRRLADIEQGDITPLRLGGMLGTARAVPLPVTPEACWPGRDGDLECPRQMTPELAELVGFFMGDGSLHAKGLRFAVHDDEFELDEYLRLAAKNLFNVAAVVEEDRRGAVHSVRMNSVRLAEWWEAAGFAKHRPEGHAGKGYSPHIPDAVLWTNDPETYGSFLRGLFEADGTVSKGGEISFTSATEQFVVDVQRLLLRLGIGSYISDQIGGLSRRPTWRLGVLGGMHTDRFIEAVGFITGRKASLLRDAGTRGTKRDYVPLTRELLDEVLPLSSCQKDTERHRLRAAAVRTQGRTANGWTTREIATEVAHLTGDQRVYEMTQYLFEGVESVTLLDGLVPTYDLSVPANVTYVANGFVSHNTISFIMGADTTGIEPDFALVKFKKLAGGGYMRIVNGSVPAALEALGYDDAARERIMTHVLGTQTLHGDTAVNAERLLEAGFTATEIDRAEAALANSSSLADAFGPWVVGDNVYERLGATGAGAELLAAAGFTADEVRSSSLDICGHLTTEGAPGLRPEHAAVFDCAVECGDGTRVISWEGHVRALGAIAPFLSGSASKTVNLPNSATVEDIEAAHDLAYQLGVKCIAVYRDGSKLSQPLSSAGRTGADGEGDEMLVIPESIPEGMSPTQFYHSTTPPRFRLPSLRYGPTWRFEIGGEEVYLRAGEYPDGTLGEVFVDWGRQGSTLRGMTAAMSIMISQALQHGMPLDKIVKSLRGHMFEPAGIVSGHDNLKMATSLVDAIVRILGHHYLGRDDLVQVKGIPQGRPAAPAAPAAVAKDVVEPTPAAEKSHTMPLPEGAERVVGATCTQCGSQALVRTGTCTTCSSCGSTSGCA